MKREVKIGLFTLLMIVGAWAGIRFLSGIDIFNHNYKLHASYNDVSGVRVASPIYIKGVKVGSVSEIKLNPSVSGMVDLSLDFSAKYEIPDNSTAEIFRDGLMGGEAIKIVFGDSKSFLKSGDSIDSSREQSIFDVAENELSGLKEMVESVATELHTTLNSLNSIMVNNAEYINGVAVNMETLTSNLNMMVDPESGDVTRMVGGLASVSQTLEANTVQIDSIFLNLNGITSQIEQARIADSLKASLDSLGELTSKLNAEGGTLGKMLNDEEVYDNLASATANLDSLLYDFRDRPDRYINVSVFGRDYDRKYAKADKKRAKAVKKSSKK